MSVREQCSEPMCETSEPGEKLISRDDLLPISLDIGHRLMEIFGYQHVSAMVFRLKSTAKEINAVLNGDELPSTELLLGIHQVTGVSIDWLLTGIGEKFVLPAGVEDLAVEPQRATPRFRHERYGEMALR